LIKYIKYAIILTQTAATINRFFTDFCETKQSCAYEIKGNSKWMKIIKSWVMKYSEPRFTKDLDVFIATDQDNAEGVYMALKEFGAPLENLTIDDFAHKGYFYQMGKPPLRVDIMMSIPGIDFNEAWENREVVQLGDLKLYFTAVLESISPAKQEALGP